MFIIVTLINSVAGCGLLVAVTQHHGLISKLMIDLDKSKMFNHSIILILTLMHQLHFGSSTRRLATSN